MNIEEIVNKAIPLTFEGVNCAALERKLYNKAVARRQQLTYEILTLLKSKTDAGNIVQSGVDQRAY